MSSSKVALEKLHELVANDLATVIKHGVVVIDDEGKAHRNPVSPAMMAQAIKFLNDNGVHCDPTKNKPLLNLVTSLPFEGTPDADDDEPPHPQH